MKIIKSAELKVFIAKESAAWKNRKPATYFLASRIINNRVIKDCRAIPTRARLVMADACKHVNCKCVKSV